MDLKEKILAWMAGREDEFTRALAKLIAVDSTMGEPAPGCPFGEGTVRAVKTALSLAEEWGLAAGEDEGYVGYADLNDREDALHILAHLDIVGVGEGWNTDPFTLVRDGDLVYGRGVQDDKGPALAALFAMRCVRELGLPVSRNVRLILGTDEETGSRDIEHYYASHPYAPYAVTPDADFPVINVEKARYAPRFGAVWQEQPRAAGHVASVDGGIRVNVAPGNCTVKILGLTRQDALAAMEAVQARTGVNFCAQEEEDALIVRAAGVQTHAAHPAGGRNAITAMLELLCALPLAEDSATQAIRTLHRFFPYGDDGGSALGIAMEDEISGKLTLVLTVLNLNETGFAARFDCRASLCATEETTRGAVERRFAAEGWTCTGAFTEGHAVDGDSDFVRTLLRSYERYSGKEGYCVSIGGGTYVHEIPGGVAFGPAEPDFESNCHGANERASISALLRCAAIYADVIANLCR